MLKSLRNRFILSHILPLFIIIPIMGIVLIYVLEAQYLLPNLTKTVTGEATLLAEITREQIDIWNEPQVAQSLLDRIGPNLRTRVMFLTPDGRLLASSDSADLDLLNQVISVPGFSEAVNRKTSTRTDYYSRSLHAEVIDVLAPVVNSQGQLVGIIRMTYLYATVADEFIQLQYLIGAILIVGLLIGAALGSLLALSMSGPIQKVTQAVFDLASGKQSGKLEEHGPDDIKMLIHAINVFQDRLHNLEQSRRQLLANLVHEIGRPLGALRSAIQALMQGAGRDPKLQEELLEGMDGEAARLQNLMEDLAHLHEQVLGTLELNRQPIRLGEWIPIVLRTWQASTRKKRIHWSIEIPPDLPEVQVDPNRLAQAIGNLVSNAIKFTPPNGKIKISAGSTDREIWIEVSDSGPGIPKEELEKIFTPFYRGYQGRRFPQGMGLGLTIAHDLIVAHTGHLDVESTRGLGSKFTIWLPLELPSPVSQK
jgi:two-component system sensor histidine kinase BaeS